MWAGRSGIWRARAVTWPSAAAGRRRLELFADSTLLGFRGAGLQDALIRERLRAAVGEGWDLATAATLAGSVSQRNYERHGFRVAYTKATLVR